ncbi:hypothetical protein ACWIDW_13340 [Microbacterium sp. NPDC055312]
MPTQRGIETARRRLSSVAFLPGVDAPLASGIRHPASGIRHRASGTPAFGIRHPASRHPGIRHPDIPAPGHPASGHPGTRPAPATRDESGADTPDVGRIPTKRPSSGVSAPGM